MKSPLVILHLEDDRNDALLVKTALESQGITCEITVVQTQVGFNAALERGNIDLILSDFSLPGFNGMAALEIARTKWPNIPFVFVSGLMGEELAIESLQNGATDYVLKERLSRLVPAVRRAMHEVEARARHRRLETQFIEAQKMDVVGQLAGGVAHDFNNILAVIMGYSQLLIADLSPEDEIRSQIEEILHAAERATALTHQLLVFSRKQTVQPVVLDLNRIVKEFDSMLRRLIEENVKLTVILGKDLGRIKADSGHVGQILMNMVVNARDAMPNGGKLLIETSNVALDNNYANAPQGATPGNYVLLAISDTGIGMTDEVQDRLFEPFFTTKPMGKGTGLGLATCRTIVKQCDSYISVSSEVDKGTTFYIYFPRVDQPLDATVGSIPTGPLPRGTETILLVEDEKSVRYLTANVLQTHGYEVLSASNGQEGLNVAREHEGEPIALVVTDVIMPEMGGNAMADWLKNTYPNLKILFTSGYTDEAIAHHGVLDPGVAFLAKPYTPATITRKVREVLDS